MSRADPRPPTVRELLESIRRREVPAAGERDPFAEAWACDRDVDAMIDLVRAGGPLGIYEIDSVQTWEGPEGPTRWLFRMRTQEGRYLRMDVTREGGADAVRAILPEIAPRKEWARAIGAERRALDPIDVLVADLRRDGRVQPDWLAAHSLRRAWRECSNSVPMRELLELLGRPDLRDRAQSAIDRIPRPPRASPGEALIPGELQRQLDAWDARLADAIRAVVPEPPPLPQHPDARPDDVPASAPRPRPAWVPIAIAALVILVIVALRALS